MNKFIFTEAYNCGPVTRVALMSFFKHHPDLTVHVYGTDHDFNMLGEIANHPKLVKVVYMVSDQYTKGHSGTAEVFAHALMNGWHYDYIIHFDGDVYFREECISLLEEAYEEGYDIAGSRRCYKNNPAKIPVADYLPDTISTYFFGIRSSKIPVHSFEYFKKMCQGVTHPIPGWQAFDFFDPVTHQAIHQKGAKIKFIDSDLIGGQDENGSKVNSYILNMHMDCGTRLIHFGGVSSGYSSYENLSSPQASYAHWAKGRWKLFARVFYMLDINYDDPCQIADGRWVNGSYNDEILEEVLDIITEYGKKDPL